MMKMLRTISILSFLSVSAFAAPWLGLTYKKSLYENHLALLVSGVHPESGCLSAGVVSGDLVIGFDGNSAGANLIQEARNGKGRSEIYVWDRCSAFVEKARSLEGYVHFFGENAPLTEVLRDTAGFAGSDGEKNS